MSLRNTESNGTANFELPAVAGGSGLVAARKFTRDLGHHPVTTWRWVERGWIGKPLNIAGRLYFTEEQIAEFKRRAAAGEFAVSTRPPKRVRHV